MSCSVPMHQKERQWHTFNQFSHENDDCVSNENQNNEITTTTTQRHNHDTPTNFIILKTTFDAIVTVTRFVSTVNFFLSLFLSSRAKNILILCVTSYHYVYYEFSDRCHLWNHLYLIRQSWLYAVCTVHSLCVYSWFRFIRFDSILFWVRVSSLCLCFVFILFMFTAHRSSHIRLYTIYILWKKK